NDAYFSFTGIGSYTTSPTLGSQNSNYYRSTYEYDEQGRLNRMVRPDGTIYRTVSDGQDRLISEWVGNDDTPTSGTWSPDNPAGMIRTALYEYDEGGIGDGLLTSATDALGRVTTFDYDFRGRQTSKTLPDPDGGGSLAPPVSYTVYDNLGRVISTTDALGNETTIAYSVNTTNRTSSITMTYPDPDGS